MPAVGGLEINLQVRSLWTMKMWVFIRYRYSGDIVHSTADERSVRSVLMSTIVRMNGVGSVPHHRMTMH